MAMTWTEQTSPEVAEAKLYAAKHEPGRTRLVVNLHGFPDDQAAAIFKRVFPRLGQPGAHWSKHRAGATVTFVKDSAAAWQPGGEHPRAPVEWARQRVFHTEDYALSDSLAAISRARREGFNGIDLNLSMTRDGVIVVNHWNDPFNHGAHDPTGKYHAGSDVKISDMTYAEVRKHVRWHTGAGIPTALEAARRAAALGVYADFEAKGDRRFEHAATWRTLAQQIQTYAPHFRGTIMSLPHLGGPGSVQNDPTQHSLNVLKAAGEAGWVTMLIGRGRVDTRYYTYSRVALVKNNRPSPAAIARYGVRYLTGSGTRFYA